MMRVSRNGIKQFMLGAKQLKIRPTASSIKNFNHSVARLSFLRGAAKVLPRTRGGHSWFESVALLAAFSSLVAISMITHNNVVEAEASNSPDKQHTMAELNQRKTVKRIYRRADIENQSISDNGPILVTFKNGVYDIANFIHNHPGGRNNLMMAAGTDLSELWSQLPFRFHMKSPLAFELLEDLRVGDLHADDVVDVDTSSGGTGRAFKDTDAPLVYPTNKIYDCIVIGSGVSGLQCAHSLKKEHGILSENILVLEAQDYVGGRVKQISNFIEGVDIDMGAEFLHGKKTLLTKFAEENNVPISEIYCWAHGDGGPMEEPLSTNGSYGLYWIKDKKTGRHRLLRFDDQDKDFVRMNEVLWSLSSLNENNYSDDLSLHDFLAAQGFSDEMMSMAAGGYANTLCSNMKELSLKQCIRWSTLWDAEGEEEGDFNFTASFKVLVDHLKKDVQIETGSAVTHVKYHLPEDNDSSSSGGSGWDLVRVTTSRGVSYYSKSLVITSSPHVLKSGLMKFEPELSADIKEALDTTVMNNIVKVFIKFSEPVWPRDLQGMIVTDDDFLLPEIWFKTLDESQVAPGEPARAYAVGFTTADYAKRVANMPKKEVILKVVNQLDEMFSHLEPRHMAGLDGSTASTADSSSSSSGGDNGVLQQREKTKQRPAELKKASEVFLGGMFWDWNPQHHPFIGGGYSSPVAGKATHLNQRLAQPYPSSSPAGKKIFTGNMFFAGEGTNLPGATAHAALESGVRAAGQVATALQQQQQQEKQ